MLDDTWSVVAGEDSKEVSREDTREKGLFEAIYPRPSAIPPKCDFFLFRHFISVGDC